MNKALILASMLVLAPSAALAADEHHPPEQAAPAAGAMGSMDPKMIEQCKAMHEADRARLDQIERRLEAIQRLLERQAKARPKR